MGLYNFNMFAKDCDEYSFCMQYLKKKADRVRIIKIGTGYSQTKILCCYRVSFHSVFEKSISVYFMDRFYSMIDDDIHEYNNCHSF